jgi:hypothetical protein
MKKINYKIFALSSVVLLSALYSCKKVLDKAPSGVLNASVLTNKAGVDGLLIGAYSILDGYYQGQPYTNYGSGISNWSFGGIGSDDAYKGSTTIDQAPDAPAIEQHVGIATTNQYTQSKWQVNYAGIQRANSVILEVPLVTDGSEAGTVGQNAIAEARFLRGIYHFELVKVFGNVPYVDEKVTYLAGNYDIPNSGPIWDKIEADFQFAMGVLPKTQPQAGRANYYAAEAFLAKAYVYDHQYAKALPLLLDCINAGTTASGAKYALGSYSDNFNAQTKNNAESVFAAQMTVNDGSNGQNDNEGDVLNFPGGGTYTTCCGFYIPSYNLANAFQVDANGLPMFQIDPVTHFPAYNNNILPNDHGIPATTAFTPTAVAVDSRLDWTVGRRGIPYLDWGLCGGEAWTRGDLAPYTPKKNAFYHSAQASTSDNGQGWAANQGSAVNYCIMRYSDILLLAAECEVEASDFADAEKYVNMVRARAADPTNWVYKYKDDTNPGGGTSATAAANYKVGLYTGQFAANGQAYARLAVLAERQLEFGMEGQRFFDLQRYDGRTGGPSGNGFMAGVLNAYYKADNRIANPVLSVAKFTSGRDEYYPIPQIEIDAEAGKLKQNPNY